MPGTIPLDAPQKVADPTALRALQQQYGGGRKFDDDGSCYAHIGDLRVKESRTAIAPQPANGHVQHRRQAQVNLEAKLIDMACSWASKARSYEISGCGCAECDGCYDFVEASAQGAPVYRSASGWVLHRDRVPELQQIGEEEIRSEQKPEKVPQSSPTVEFGSSGVQETFQSPGSVPQSFAPPGSAEVEESKGAKSTQDV
eukprot:s319_g2.t1